MLKVVIWHLFFSQSEKPSEIEPPLPTLVHLDLAKRKLLGIFHNFLTPWLLCNAIIVCQETTLLILFSLTYNINVLKYAWKTITRVR